MPYSLEPHGLQHARLPCSSLSLEFTQTQCPLSRWCHPSHPLLPPSSPALNLCQHQALFQWVSPKYWSFNFSLSISPYNEYLGLISFRINWFDLLAVQETVKSLLQHHNLKASILWCSAFFMVQLSHLHMTTGKTITSTIIPLFAKWCLCFLICCLGLNRNFDYYTFVCKVMSLLFNMLSRFVIVFFQEASVF